MRPCLKRKEKTKQNKQVLLNALALTLGTYNPQRTQLPGKGSGLPSFSLLTFLGWCILKLSRKSEKDRKRRNTENPHAEGSAPVVFISTLSSFQIGTVILVAGEAQVV